MDKKSILLVQPRYHTNQHPVVKTLHDNGHDVFFLSIRKKVTEPEIYDVIKPDIMKYSMIFRFVKYFIKSAVGEKFNYHWGFPCIYWYYNYLRSRDLDIIIVKEYYPVSWITIILAKILDIDIIFYDQDPLFANDGIYKKKIISLVIYYILNYEKFVRITPVLGDPTKNTMRKKSYYVPFVAPTWCSPEKAEFDFESTKRIISIGKLHVKRKNHLFLIRAIEKLEYDNVELTIIGSLTDEENIHYNNILDYINRHNLNDCVEIKENLSYKEVQKQYSKGHLFVLPSSNEPAAVSHLEAMNAGLPVICSESNGTSSYVCNKENGYTFEENNLQDLTNKIDNIVRSNDKIQKYGDNSLKFANKIYGPDAYYKRLEVIIKDNFHD